MRPHVVIVGGGLAGLTAALECADGGARVSLLEARPRLGGATWSARSRGLDIDNGQHVFLRCFESYRRFLRRVGADDRVTLQRRMAVPVLAPGGRRAWLRRSPLPSPAHLAPSLLRFPFLAPGARLRVARSARRLAALDPDDARLDETSLGDWLTAQGEDPRATAPFWDLLIRPTLNLSAADASLALAAKVFRTGLFSAPDAGDVGWATAPLDRVHGEPALAALRDVGARVHLRSRVRRIVSGRTPALELEDGRIAADAVVLATPHGDAAGLLPPDSGVDAERLWQLGHSPIVSLHVVFDRPVFDLPFAAGVHTPLQWVFDRSASAGLARGQYLAVPLSAADEFVGCSREELRARFLPAFEALLPAARGVRVLDFFVTCEREATFRQRPGTRALRPGTRTHSPGLFLAGAWTDTGWPATMEGAVRSGEAAARAALAFARRPQPTSRLPARGPVAAHAGAAPR